MTPPVIGIALHAQDPAVPAPPRLIRNRAYFTALHGAGAGAVGIPASAGEDALRAVYEPCDALLLAGGPDVAPQQYGDEVHAAAGVESDAELDAAELALLRWALDDGRPVLAICRGMQLLNVALGGTLWQDLRSEMPGALEHTCKDRAALVHVITVEPGSVLHRLTGDASLRVNSLHHQGIRQLANPLRATACAPDGLVEAVEMPGHRFVVGVQCHPEEITATAPWTRALFQEFVAAIGG
jgi:putative glutamine amidotransferase